MQTVDAGARKERSKAAGEVKGQFAGTGMRIGCERRLRTDGIPVFC
jgi:hypothetical protein